ncbi:hypothetical protein NGRA_1193 [Nosema granulosis]|uniref:CCHC-type domain-containing protein n=1 Tax=Nosema granulosis TaxID=83296 RepID=A0A9P6GYW3_9MICR|nr:hypothetical protein NGRA_1193 [Nosema granulosis]
MLDVERVELRQVLEVASSDLQDFIFEKIYSGLKEWKEIRENLERVARNEEMEERDKIYEEILEKVMTEYREKQKAERIRLYRERRLARERSQCFICVRFGYHARECRSNKESKLKDEQTEHRTSTKITVHKNRDEIIKSKSVQEEIKKVDRKTGKDS